MQYRKKIFEAYIIEVHKYKVWNFYLFLNVL
jgi:hypothetical protein